MDINEALSWIGKLPDHMSDDLVGGMSCEIEFSESQDALDVMNDIVNKTSYSNWDEMIAKEYDKRAQFMQEYFEKLKVKDMALSTKLENVFLERFNYSIEDEGIVLGLL